MLDNAFARPADGEGSFNRLIPMAKILLVEDDLELASTTSSWLEAERHEVSHTANGVEGLARLINEDYDIAILDWELPNLSGLEICRQYRAGQGTVPIIMLTGKGAINDRTTGLDSGADDYLVKPFSLKELSSRIRALLRRPASIAPTLIEVGRLRLDTAKFQVLKDGNEVQLMPRDFALLEFLMRNPGTVFSADILLRKVWENDSEASPDALRTSIKRLRKKLDDGESEDVSFIQNIPRVGYKLRAK